MAPFALLEAREWKSADGSRTFEGQLVDYDPPVVTVVLDDGRELQFQDNLLGDADKRYCQIGQDLLLRSAVGMPYRILKIQDAGVLAADLPFEAIQYQPEEPDYYAHPGGVRKRENPYFLNQPIFIWGDYTDTVAEGEEYCQDLYWAGSYRYVAADGVAKTIRGYAPTLDEAVRIWRGRESRPDSEESPDSEGANLMSTGTGFAISATGHIVTNAHVIEGAVEVSVLVGEAEYEASVLARDRANDLTILKIDAVTEPLKLADASEAKLGDPVAVSGFPNPDIQGHNIKLTRGALSALSGVQDDLRFFQIDAAIQPGNSGSPLLDEKNRVIGIVSGKLNDAAIAVATGSIPQNVNYAVKVDYLLPLIKSVEGLSKAVSTVKAVSWTDMSDLSGKAVFIVQRKGDR